jgi:DNA (cytosine-5)-methyltransferase 1
MRSNRKDGSLSHGVGCTRRFAGTRKRRPQVGGKWGDLRPTIPAGENYLWHTDRGRGKPLFGWRTRYWSFLLKLSKRLPSWTVQAQPGAAIGPFHWNTRKLSFHELCRIQTFPDSLLLGSGRTEMQRMLGNAVPSLIAEVLAREIRRQFFDAPLRAPLKLLPPKRVNVPLPQKISRAHRTPRSAPRRGQGAPCVKTSRGTRSG